ncbi:MAG: citrate lyase holo-[acyl-carrier protein] synthase [Azospirillaceae bacterium]|nr:citrate lyase holo-[acyl-carrier protein] synthase [Azospirillaceae bacterium]
MTATTINPGATDPGAIDPEAGDRRAGPVVVLEQLLQAREDRVIRRNAVLAWHRGPVVAVSVVMPGPVKDCLLARRVQAAALDALVAACADRGWPAHAVYAETPPSGPEALFAVTAAAEAVKRAMIELEDQHPLGRLWDLDVIAPDRHALSRRALGFAPRRCLVCQEPAHACARSQAHGLDGLLAVMENRLDAWTHALRHRDV